MPAIAGIFIYGGFIAAELATTNHGVVVKLGYRTCCIA